ncbi:MAG: hypothetical protein ABIL70_08165 [candidate division WOR-3 bacterium]
MANRRDRVTLNKDTKGQLKAVKGRECSVAIYRTMAFASSIPLNCLQLPFKLMLKQKKIKG